MTFDAEGNVFPCDCFAGQNEMSLGSIYGSIDTQATSNFEKEIVDIRNGCQTCWVREHSEVLTTIK